MTDKAANHTAAQGSEPRRSPALSKREVRAAIHAEAGLYVLGGLLCSTALLIPHVRAPEAVAAVGFVALFVAAGLFVAAERHGAGWSWRSSAICGGSC